MADIPRDENFVVVASAVNTDEYGLDDPEVVVIAADPDTGAVITELG